MTHARRVVLTVGARRSFPAPLAQQQQRYFLITSSGTIGTLTVTESGRSVDTDYRVDDNGRGSKPAEH